MGRQRASRSRNHVQALNHAERTQSKVVAEDREEPVEEGCGPADFGQDEDNDLEDDELDEELESGEEACSSGSPGPSSEGTSSQPRSHRSGFISKNSCARRASA